MEKNQKLYKNEVVSPNISYENVPNSPAITDLYEIDKP